jgi:alkylation response protein AidB-like acyl-CoA dehydrogenase
MASKGVDVRPIKQMTGAAEFSEIFLTDVFIPDGNIIGERNNGWRVAQSTLSAERGVLAFERAERQRRFAEARLKAAVEHHEAWIDDSGARAQLIDLICELQSLRKMIRFLLSGEEEQSAKQGTAFIVKLCSTTLAQRFSDFLVRMSPVESQIFARSVQTDGFNPVFDHLNSFGDTISAGTNEIMRNIIAERVLGMPR